MTTVELRRLAGSVVMVGFRGLEAGPETFIHRQIAELHIGGVILFDKDVQTGQPLRNIADPSQLHRLTAELREAGVDRLLIAVDQEGGQVARLNPGNGFPQFPAHAEMGEKYDPTETRLVSGEMARVLRTAGINLNFAPVVDLNLNPGNPIIGSRGRSFSQHPRIVAQHAAAFIEGHRQHGVLTALKHFPGHGSSALDSHLHLTDITETFVEQELNPYRELIGLGLVDVVMAGHLVHRGVDGERPASLSSSWLDGKLRMDLGFQGVVVTDDLDMVGAAENRPLSERVATAMNAGVDLLLFGNNQAYDPDRPRQVVEAIVAAVTDGSVPVSRLMVHAGRVERLRSSLAGK